MATNKLLLWEQNARARGLQYKITLLILKLHKSYGPWLWKINCKIFLFVSLCYFCLLAYVVQKPELLSIFCLNRIFFAAGWFSRFGSKQSLELMVLIWLFIFLNSWFVGFTWTNCFAKFTFCLLLYYTARKGWIFWNVTRRWLFTNK